MYVFYAHSITYGIVYYQDEPEFCCNEQRDFCILKALFTKKMMEDKIKKMPGKIPIGKDSKVKKSPEERALER